MPDVAFPPPITLASLLLPGIAAVKKYGRPFLFLQSIALGLVVLYYTNANVKSVCDQLSRLKIHGGLIFAALAAAVAGGLLPELAKALIMGDWTITRKRVRDVGFAMAAFAASGIITDFQYRGMARLIGSDTTLITSVRKMLFDQFVTTPIYGTPYWVVIYLFRAERYNLLATLRQLSPRWYVRRVLPLLIPGWCFWMPMVLLIYSLPGGLQFCLYCVAAAAWSLLMVFIATHEAAKSIREE
jgi:hypothetical protein